MSKEEFDALLLKKIQSEELEYNPAQWDLLSQLLPPVQPAEAAVDGFDELLREKFRGEALTYDAGQWAQLAALLPSEAMTAESPQAFDGMLREKLERETLPYNPEHWKQLLQRLYPARRQRWAMAAGIAATIALLVTGSLLLKNMRTPVPSTTVPELAQQPSPVARPAAKPGNASPATTGTAPLPALQVPQLARQRQGTTVPNQPAYTPGPAPAIPGVPPVIQNNDNAPVSPSPLPEPQLAVAPAQLQQEKPAKDKPDATVVPGNSQPDYSYSRQYASAFYEGNGRKQEARTNLALGGGVNYGNLNTGYSAGISVRHKVAGDFFVDGTVAMLYNNNAINVAENNGPSLQGIAARPASATVSAPALDPIDKLYYVQFSPSVGYQIEKHVALSVGGDFQRMLNRKDEIVRPENNNSKVIPNFDVGLAARSEFSITPNIQAGLVYREGLNNLLKNDGAKYLNRRYIQVQFKYNLPVN